MRKLEAGWYECRDPASDQSYYWHRGRDAVQWHAPEAVAAADAALPSGWLVCWDSVAARIFFWHQPTGQRSWARPPAVRARLLEIKRMFQEVMASWGRVFERCLSVSCDHCVCALP